MFFIFTLGKYVIMKRSSLLFGLCIYLCSCSKSDEPTPISPNTPPTTIVTPPSTTKNYLLPSYDLQKSDVNIDVMQLRRTKEGINSGWNILAVSFLDINGDGKDDIFYNSSFGENVRTQGKIFIYKNGDYVLDDSYFTTPPSLIHPRKSIIGDFNNDKMPDIFIAAHGDDRPPFAGEYTVMLLSNTSKKYNLVKFSEREDFYHGACSGDIDKDGDLDIFVLGRLDSYFLINDGKGNFTYSLNHIDKSKLIEQYQCELVDIDKDGFLDLIIGGHEFMSGNTTRIYWGNSTYKFTTSIMTSIPALQNWGVITDLDVHDLDSDGVNEILISRTGGRPQDFTTYFYSGWQIQVFKLTNREVSDQTSTFIENNVYNQATPNNQEWIPWIGFNDIDKNGKMDFYSTKCTNLNMVRWELQNKKLIRVQ
jgi:hypothetical protein